MKIEFCRRKIIVLSLIAKFMAKRHDVYNRYAKSLTAKFNRVIFYRETWGGAKFSTGGDSPRAGKSVRQSICASKKFFGRLGEIPRPTVKVRMKKFPL